MDAADDPATCPQGHDDAVRLLSLVAKRSVGVSSAGAGLPMAGGGGCCGGGCCAN